MSKPAKPNPQPSEPSWANTDLSLHEHNGRTALRLTPVQRGITVPTPEGSLTFYTPAELRAIYSRPLKWLWDGYLIPGGITLMAGKPKVGKTTLMLSLIEAVITAAGHFLGRPITPTPAIYLAEESFISLEHKLAPIPNVHILAAEQAFPKQAWASVMGAAADAIAQTHSKLLIVDTFSFWGSLPSEHEKDAGAVQQTMDPLREIASTLHCAILISHHQRKGGGEEGEGIRGSSALVGSVDIAVELERIQAEEADPNHRNLFALSRFPTTPGALIVARDPDTRQWSTVWQGSERAEAKIATSTAAILDTLDATPRSRAELLSVTGLSWGTLHPKLNALLKSRKIKRVGTGHKNDPFRYAKAPR